jgi:hypothetical protein
MSVMDWTKFYYANPTPDRFAAEIRAAVAQGIAENPGAQLAFAMFLGRVMAANPQRIAAWIEELSDLAAARQLLQLAAWMSGTGEGQVWLRAAGADSRMLNPPPDILTVPLDGVVLDMLWSTYFATGDERAVRRVVSALGLLDDRGAAQRFATSAKTEDDRRRAMNDSVFQAAEWSLRALMAEHAPLVAVCERIFETSELAPNERITLAIVLQSVVPTRWEVKIDGATGMATVNKRA